MYQLIGYQEILKEILMKNIRSRPFQMLTKILEYGEIPNKKYFINQVAKILAKQIIENIYTAKQGYCYCKIDINKKMLNQLPQNIRDKILWEIVKNCNESFKQ